MTESWIAIVIFLHIVCNWLFKCFQICIIWTPWDRPDYQGVPIFQVSLCTKGLLWDLNWVYELCRCPYFRVSTITCSTVCTYLCVLCICSDILTVVTVVYRNSDGECNSWPCELWLQWWWNSFKCEFSLYVIVFSLQLNSGFLVYVYG